VLDWIDCIGGAPLVDHIFRVFSKDLATETLHDVRQRIIDNIETLVMAYTKKLFISLHK
jgi:hypothetical protein